MAEAKGIDVMDFVDRGLGRMGFFVCMASSVLIHVPPVVDYLRIGKVPRIHPASVA